MPRLAAALYRASVTGHPALRQVLVPSQDGARARAARPTWQEEWVPAAAAYPHLSLGQAQLLLQVVQQGVKLGEGLGGWGGVGWRGVCVCVCERKGVCEKKGMCV